MNKVTKIIGIIVISVIASIATVFVKAPSTTTVIEKGGAVSGPDIFADTIGLNGVKLAPRAQRFAQGTTTVCSMKSPTATSSLTAATVNLDIGTTTSILSFEIGRDATAYSTTTLIGTTYRVAAGAKGSIVASTSPAAGAATVFPPNTFLNVIAAPSAATGNLNATGGCTALFQMVY